MATPNRSLFIRAGLVLLTLTLGMGAYILGTNLVMQGRDVDETPGTTPDETVTFTDDQAGIKLSYPESWRQIENNSRIEISEEPETQIRLIVGPEQNQPTLKIRVVHLDTEIDYDPDMTAGELAAVLETYEQELIAGPNVEVLSRRPINDKGLLGLHYLYAFKEQATGREGIHSHYFIFHGAKMNVLIFEALPRSEFDGLAPAFDAILESFNSTRRALPAGAPAPAAPESES